jgi:drug/metabolite transporter (DMT)-like permease
MSPAPSSVGGLFFALATATCYGLNIVSARVSADAGILGPSLITWRVAVMLVLAAGLSLFFRWSLSVAREERRALAVLSLACSTVGLCYLSSVSFIPVTVAAVVFYTFPICIVLASPFVEGRRISAALLFIVLMAFAGVVLVVGPGFGDLDIRGLLLAAGASLSATVQFFAAARCPRTSTASKIFWIHVFILPTGLLAAAFTGGLAGPAMLAAAPFAVAFTIAGFLVGFVLQLAALTRISAVVAGLAFCVEPLMAALSSAVFLGERLHLLQYAGGGLVIAAIVANVVLEQRRMALATKPAAA